MEMESTQLTTQALAEVIAGPRARNIHAIMDLNQVSIFRHIDPNLRTISTSIDILFNATRYIRMESLQRIQAAMWIVHSIPFDTRGNWSSATATLNWKDALVTARYVGEWLIGRLTKLIISLSSALNSPRLLKVA